MAEDWRDRYLQLADRHEQDQLTHAEAERDLIRLVTRLCVAFNGLDPQLDPHLNRLRNAAKSTRTATLLREAGELADALVQVPDERARPGVLQRLAGHLGRERRETDELIESWARVAADPARASGADLDRLAGLLQFTLQAADPAPAQPRRGLFARLVTRAADGERHVAGNRVLAEVLTATPWPEAMRDAVTDFHTRLGSDAPADAWIGIVRGIGDLAVHAVGEAQANARAAESFLAELSERLEAFDRHITLETEREAASRASGDRLDADMSDAVARLKHSVQHSESLADLQAGVQASLDRMLDHIRSHISEENARRVEAEDEAAQLRDQLHGLERQSFDLRRQVARTTAQALQDPLTGLPNRRAYDQRVIQEHARFRRFGEPLALLVFDIDNFKRLNDSLGHKSGDKALVNVGRLLGERLRETDFLARYGGEEFVVLLPGAAADDAMRLAEQMRQAVEQGGLHAHGQPVELTVSAGTACFAADETAEAVFERADRALYAAKRGGKNCVMAG